ncbi:MAG: dGTP triphosphohydrolase [Planctomycetota bacterium]|jgi:dGTPase
MSKLINGYAISEQFSGGRAYAERPHPYRSAFERDRDRIIHCQAFRRLEGKTQVFTPGLDDNYRNRLTHTIEVAQIGRTIAKVLGLNESLTEAICLGHDLGHPPFGHTGEQILDEIMTQFDGFEHNKQTLRIVDLLEHPYPDFAGLNLMYETRLGLAKHKSSYDSPKAAAFKEVNCSLEGQAADIADRIAYNCHDLEDGMRAGIIKDKKLDSIAIYKDAKQKIKADKISDEATRRTRTAKAIIDKLASDCIETSRERIENANAKNIEDIYNNSENLIVLSPENEKKLIELENFLMENFYKDKSVTQTTGKVKAGLKTLFEKFCQKPDLMAVHFQRLIDVDGLQRIACDYIAGMTDRFCLKMLEKI